MTITVFDPTYGDEPAEFVPAQRPDSLAGLTVGIVSNGKQGTRVFFDALERELVETYGVAHVDQVVKPNYSAPAGDEIMDRAKKWNALVAGIGD